ncbi:hypothetical protein ASD8599_02948 [Ascidiaceihabitans donghaensis]|uniref:GST C-terminal domain-containing protein n=1 Tax=Ascidiaceihabitans donghaensis TaxID=1510460 RepID=A0A2R8BGJ1_9RHOB|nr:glutathione S-transferase C-terminal domain-containing protein [Ascidiaceihabitans donghaensis]SPH22202.1 hypothetical protein ASD8599_02948 [Ascidiaceihabitans donghaensis]
MSKPLLITLLPSSGVDTSRWVLAHYDYAYTERPHAPIFHVLALKSWGLTKDQYPGLVVDGKVAAYGSKGITLHLDPQMPEEKRLMPDDEAGQAKVLEMANYAGNIVGGAVVNWSYWNLLKYKSVVWSSVTTSVPWYEKLTLRVAFPLIRWAMYKGLELDQAVADEALKTIYEGFDKIDALLADGRTYMYGDRLTYADLITAACLGPMILAQGYHGMLPNHALCPVFMQKVYAELRQRPTGLYIQRMYDLHRPAQLLQV